MRPLVVQIHGALGVNVLAEVLLETFRTSKRNLAGVHLVLPGGGSDCDRRVSKGEGRQN